MLKRQRASSPPPASPTVPQVTQPEDIIDIRELKRRRVLPPSLDGKTRGWNTEQERPPGDENEDKEEYEEEEECGGRSEAAVLPLNEEYQSVNNVLKEIHILHKHRQSFLAPTHMQDVYTPHAPVTKSTVYPSEEDRPVEESARVYGHYEGANRSLASAFLSRRRQHGS